MLLLLIIIIIYRDSTKCITPSHKKIVSSSCLSYRPFIVQWEVGLFGDIQVVVFEYCCFFERSRVPQPSTFQFYLSHVCRGDKF